MYLFLRFRYIVYNYFKVFLFFNWQAMQSWNLFFINWRRIALLEYFAHGQHVSFLRAEVLKILFLLLMIEFLLNHLILLVLAQKLLRNLLFFLYYLVFLLIKTAFWVFIFFLFDLKTGYFIGFMPISFWFWWNIIE